MIALNLAPMIDVVFLLLIYFMLSMQFSSKERAVQMDVAADPPETTSADPFSLPEQPIMVIVRSTGDGVSEYQLSTDSPSVGALRTFDDLARALSAARLVLLDEDQRFVIAPDASTRWEHTVAAVSAVRRGGFSRVRMAAPEGLVLR